MNSIDYAGIGYRHLDLQHLLDRLRASPAAEPTAEASILDRFLRGTEFYDTLRSLGLPPLDATSARDLQDPEDLSGPSLMALLIMWALLQHDQRRGQDLGTMHGSGSDGIRSAGNRSWQSAGPSAGTSGTRAPGSSPTTSPAATPRTDSPPLTGDRRAAWGNPSVADVERQLDARGVESPLKPYAGYIIDRANHYGVPVSMVLAVLNQESGYGTDPGVLRDNNNFFGLTGSGTAGSVTVPGVARQFAAFNTVEEGIDAAIRNMAGDHYKGLTLAQYLGLYLTGDPSGGDDGYGNTTSSYINNAIAIVENLGGNAGADTVVVPA